MAFPKTELVTDTTTHTIGANTWKWNGYAWDRQASAVSGDDHGHTGADVVDSFNGLTGDVTTNALVLPVAGISSSGGATFGDPIFVPNTFNLRNSNGDTVLDVATRNVSIGDVDSAGNATDINIRDSHNAIYLNAPGQIRLNAPDVYIENGGHLGSLSDTNTHINFAGSDVKHFLAGGVTYAQGTATGLVLPAGLSASGGATFSENVSVGATLSVDNNIVIGNGRDLIFDGSSSSEIHQNGNVVALFAQQSGLIRFPIYSVQISQFLTHNDDSDTHLEFNPDRVRLTAGDNTGLDMTATETTIDGVTFADGGATFAGNIVMSGDIISNENFNIQRPSGELVFSALGSSTIINNSGANQDIIIKGNGDSQLIYSDAGNNKVGIGTGTPEEKLHVIGNIGASGATFAGDVLIDGGTDGDAKLIIKSDTDNNDENDNPLIRLEQDGGAISTSIGMLGDDDAQFSGAIANMFYIEADGSAGNNTHGIQFATANSARMTINSDGNVGINEKFPAQRLDVDGIIQAQTGITLGAQGITFNDGTNRSTALRTDSYTGQIETASDKTYTLDPKVSTARTITGFYIKSASGTVTATLKNGSDTIKAASVSSSSGDQSSLANTSVAADAVLTLVTSSNSSALDVIFNVEYTSSS